jgi:hypothetical protein
LALRSVDRLSVKEQPDLNKELDSGSNKLLLPLEDAATTLSFTPRQVERLARLRDIAHIEVDGQLYFSIEALREWVARNSTKVW